MKYVINLVDYEEKYADEINEIRIDEWGRDCATFGSGKIIGDAFYIDSIVIKKEFRNKSIGSMLLNYFINYARKLNLANLICEGVLSNERMNIAPLMKKYNFEEILRIKDYWGFKHPDDYCNVCQNKPCRCTSVIFKKEL